MNCLEERDLESMARSVVESFDRRIAGLPEDLCAPFFDEARQLETELLGLYKLVALLAGNVPPEDIATVEKLWRLMVRACDESASRLNSMCRRHPACGADYYYDRVLDLRNKCSRLQELHS